jgi:hypothetical protein
VREAAAAALVGLARRLHHAIERQAGEPNDSVTDSAVARQLLLWRAADQIE